MGQKSKKKNKKPIKTESNFLEPYCSVFLWVAPLLVALISFLFLYPSLSFDFTNFDDPQLLVNNQIIKDFDIKAMFTRFVYKDYLPLTFLSYAIENHYWGMKASVFHTTNTLFHILNIFLLYFFLIKLTKGKLFVSSFCTFLFAIFPTQPESIVWLSERKDVLSGFFFFCSLIAYLYYLDSKTRTRGGFFYVLVFLSLSLSLFSKAMAVPMAFILLAIDYYKDRPINKKVLLEKLPFLLVGLTFVVVHILGHEVEGEKASTSFNPFVRLFVGGESYLFYIARTVFPYELSNYYEGISYTMPPQNYLLGLLGLFLILYFIGDPKFNNKKALFGLLFYSFLILPVLNIVPLRGSLVYADRYLYVAGIGLFFAYAAILQHLFLKLTVIKKSLLVFFVTSLMGYNIYLFHKRIYVWQNSFTLWSSILETTPGSVIANMQLALAYKDLGNIKKALEYGKRGLNENPNNAAVNYTMGLFHYQNNTLQEAQKHLDLTLKLNPNHAQALSVKALVFKKQGRVSEGRSIMKQAISLAPYDNTVRVHKAEFGL